MFIDVRGRDLRPGDLVIYDLNSSYKRFAYGVIVAENKITHLYGNISKVIKPTYCVLIEHPNEDEMELKNTIIDEYNKVINTQVKFNTEKVRLGSSYKMGDILSTKDGYYLYLGNIELKNQYLDLSGHAYISCPIYDKSVSYNVSKYLKSIINYYVAIKTNKNYYGNFSGGWTIELLKTKSTKFNSVVGHLDREDLKLLTDKPLIYKEKNQEEKLIYFIYR